LIEAVRAASERGGLEWVGPEARTSAGTWTAALLAVGGLLEAVDRVAASELNNAFVCCRPPGHHASADQAMGFCLFNAVAVAARPRCVAAVPQSSWSQRVRTQQRAIPTDA